MHKNPSNYFIKKLYKVIIYLELLYQNLSHLNPSISISENVVNLSTFFHATEYHIGLKHTARMIGQKSRSTKAKIHFWISYKPD